MASASYPVRLDVQRPASHSRLLNFPLIGLYIRALLLIPNLFVFFGLATAAFIAYFMSLWAILFTGRYPRGLFKLEVSVLRWQTNINAYICSAC